MVIGRTRLAVILTACVIAWPSGARADLSPAGLDPFEGQKAVVVVDHVTVALALLRGLAVASPGRNLVISPLGTMQAGLTAISGLPPGARIDGPFAANGLRASFQVDLADKIAAVMDRKSAAGLTFSKAFFTRTGRDEPSGPDVQRARHAFGPSVLLSGDGADLGTLNAWASGQSQGTLTALVPGLPLEHSDYLATATSLKADVGGGEVKVGKFVGEGGKTTIGPFVTLKGHYNFGRIGGFQAVCLPIGRAKELRLVLFLPLDTKTPIARQIPDKRGFFDVIKCLRDAKPEAGVVKIPMFSIQNHLELGHELERLGLTPTNLEPGTRLPGWDSSRTFGGILQASRFEVTKSGGVPILTSGDEPGTQAIEFRRPFLFAVRNDRTHGLYLFGVVRNLGAARR